MTNLFQWPFNLDAAERNEAAPQPYPLEVSEPQKKVRDGELIIAPHHNALRQALVGDLKVLTAITPEQYRLGIQQVIGPFWSRLHSTYSQLYDITNYPDLWEFNGAIPYDTTNPETRVNANFYQQENRMLATIYDIDPATGLVTTQNNLEGLGTILGRIRYQSGNSYVYNSSFKYCYLDADIATWPGPADHIIRRQHLLDEYWWIYNVGQTIVEGVTDPWGCVYDSSNESSTTTYTCYGRYSIRLGIPDANDAILVEYFDEIPWSPYNEGANYYTDIDPVLNMSIVYKASLTSAQIAAILAGSAESPVFRFGIEVYDINHVRLGDYYCDVDAIAVAHSGRIPWTKVTASFIPTYNPTIPTNACVTAADLDGTNCYNIEIEIGAARDADHYSSIITADPVEGYIAFVRPFIFRERPNPIANYNDAYIYIGKIDVYEGSQTLYNLDLKQGRVCDTLYFGNNTGVVQIAGADATPQLPLYKDPTDSTKDVFIATSQITHCSPLTGGISGSGAPDDGTAHTNLAELIDTYIYNVAGAYLRVTGDTIVYDPTPTATSTRKSALIWAGRYLANNMDTMIASGCNAGTTEATYTGGIWTTTGNNKGGFYFGPYHSTYSYTGLLGSVTNGVIEPYIEGYECPFAVDRTSIVTAAPWAPCYVLDIGAVGVESNIERETVREYMRHATVPDATKLPKDTQMRIHGSLVIGRVGTGNIPGMFSSFDANNVYISNGKVDGIDVYWHNHTGGTMGQQIPLTGLGATATALMFDSASDKAEFATLVGGGDVGSLHSHHVDDLLPVHTTGGVPYLSMYHGHVLTAHVFSSSLGSIDPVTGLAFIWYRVKLGDWDDYAASDVPSRPKRIELKPIRTGSAATSLSGLLYSWECILTSSGTVPATEWSYEFYGPIEITGDVGGDTNLVPHGLVGAGNPLVDTWRGANVMMASAIKVEPVGFNWRISIRDMLYWVAVDNAWTAPYFAGLGKNLSDFPTNSNEWLLTVYF